MKQMILRLPKVWTAPRDRESGAKCQCVNTRCRGDQALVLRLTLGEALKLPGLWLLAFEFTMVCVQKRMLHFSKHIEMSPSQSILKPIVHPVFVSPKIGLTALVLVFTPDPRPKVEPIPTAILRLWTSIRRARRGLTRVPVLFRPWFHEHANTQRITVAPW